MTNQSESFTKIIKLNGKKLQLEKEIERLKPKAVKELRALGYSYDKIVKVLGVAKVNAIKYSKNADNKKSI